MKYVLLIILFFTLFSNRSHAMNCLGCCSSKTAELEIFSIDIGLPILQLRERYQKEDIIYLTKRELKKKQLYINDEGKITNSKGQQIIQGKRLMIILDANGLLYAKSKVPGLYHHSSFSSGDNVQFAGNFEVDSNGDIIYIDNSSGHYRTHSSYIVPLLEKLQDKGLSINKVRIRIVVENDPSLNKLKRIVDKDRYREIHIKINGSIDDPTGEGRTLNRFKRDLKDKEDFLLNKITAPEFLLRLEEKSD